MSFHPLRSVNVTKIPRKNPYIAPVDQYMNPHKDYSNRGVIVERTFHNFEGFQFSRTLPLEEYNNPQFLSSERINIGTGASPSPMFLYGDPQPY